MAYLDKRNVNNKTTESSRICILTTRDFDCHTFRCGFYEGQDILMEIDNVDLISLLPKKGYHLRRNIHESLIWHDFTKKSLKTNLTIQPIELTKEYDVFIAYLPYLQDIMHLPAIKQWKKKCKTSILWVNELWLNTLDKPLFNKAWLAVFDQFDHIAVGLDSTAHRLSQLLKRPCTYIPTGIDALRFSAYPNKTPRCIDFYSMGRVLPEIHINLLDFAKQHNLFYVYDTFQGGDSQVNNYKQHRDMFVNYAKRAQYFTVAPAKIDATRETAGQIEIGARYFEAAGAGAILLGQSPECAAFKKLFNWEDAVIEVKADGSDLGCILTELSKQPERRLQISRRNTIESLLQHDWLYRWQQIIHMSGLKPSPRLASRAYQLKSLAQLLQNDTINISPQVPTYP